VEVRHKDILITDEYSHLGIQECKEYLAQGLFGEDVYTVVFLEGQSIFVLRSNYWQTISTIPIPTKKRLAKCLTEKDRAKFLLGGFDPNLAQIDLKKLIWEGKYE
jgi:hypothetical protein